MPPSSPRPRSPSPDGDDPSPPPTRGAALDSGILAAGLLLAFSPTLVDLGHHWLESPWARYSALFPVLFARCALREGGADPRRGALVWILLGLGIELVAALAGALRGGRVGLALAAFGLCRLRGLASARTALLLVGVVPVPASIVKLGSPELPALLLETATGLWSGLGAAVSLEGGAAVTAHGALYVGRYESGIALAPLLAGLGWYDGVLRSRPLARTFAACAALALLAAPLQLLAVVGAVGLAALGHAGTAGALLPHLPWIAVAVTGVALCEARRRREDAP